MDMVEGEAQGDDISKTFLNDPLLLLMASSYACNVGFTLRGPQKKRASIVCKICIMAISDNVPFPSRHSPTGGGPVH